MIERRWRDQFLLAIVGAPSVLAIPASGSDQGVLKGFSVAAIQPAGALTRPSRPVPLHQ
jgi:hypothetical protein